MGVVSRTPWLLLSTQLVLVLYTCIGVYNPNGFSVLPDIIHLVPLPFRVSYIIFTELFYSARSLLATEFNSRGLLSLSLSLCS